MSLDPLARPLEIWPDVRVIAFVLALSVVGPLAIHAWVLWP